MLHVQTTAKAAATVCNLFLEKSNKHFISRVLFAKSYHHQHGCISTEYSESKNKCNSRLKLQLPCPSLRLSIPSLRLDCPSSTPVRCLHSSTGLKSPAISDVHVAGDTRCVDVTVGGEVLNIPFVWLRDHCRSETYYNHATNQKNADPALLQRDLTPRSVAVSESGDSLLVVWKDGHESHFPSQWLQDNVYPGRVSRVVQRSLWDRKYIESQLPRVDHADHMGSEDGLKKTLANLVKYGFCMVDGSPTSVDGTQAVVERITFVLQTLFGGMWSFTADASRSDTAYSTLGLGAHTDTTYMDLPAGIQVFQCLKHTGRGGETLLVDGFRAVDEFRRSYPAEFELLSRVVIPHEYREPPGEHSSGYHLYSLGSVIRLHPASREILQLRFNPYDRAPLNTVPPHQQEEFYHAYDKLARIIAKQEGELWVKLRPGTVLLIDNWRVMHGRSAFDGERVMCGCYMPRDEWVSRARMFGLL